MIDINSLIIIAVAIAVVYFVIKFIVSPIIKLVAGIIIIAVAFFILQKYFNVDFNQILEPLFQYAGVKKLMEYLSPISSFFSKLLPFLQS
jgi:hypothetical protein